MKTTPTSSFFTAGILFLGLSTSCLAAPIPEKVDINLQASNPALSETYKDSKSVPGFSHAKHATILLKENSAHVGRIYDNQSSCTACHAGVESGEDIQSEATKQKQRAGVNDAGGVKNYMHALCLECHKSLKKEGLTTGPTSCSGCHTQK
ncbi:MAG: cytochrome c family protein [Proteobacteria bacterium]|nr:cytochrome c family protein [Pseudomonadota bacterium]MBU1640000.1 cytochrome c family protein [Pseudomonadota bacterium]